MKAKRRKNKKENITPSAARLSSYLLFSILSLCASLILLVFSDRKRVKRKKSKKKKGKKEKNNTKNQKKRKERKSRKKRISKKSPSAARLSSYLLFSILSLCSSLILLAFSDCCFNSEVKFARDSRNLSVL